MSNSPRLGVQLVPDGAMDLDQPFNNLARQLDQVLNVRVLSATTAAQPGAPASGALYILPAGPTGASWAGKATGTLALFDSGTWYFSTPTGFIVAHVVDTGAVLAWSGTAWVNHETLLGAKGTDVAAAATVTLANATGDYVHITGTTTITSFGAAKAGLERTLVHDAAHTLTHSANIINLTGANVVTAAGDISKWRNDGGTVWRMVGYVRASGRSLIGPQLDQANAWSGDNVFNALFKVTSPSTNYSYVEIENTAAGGRSYSIFASGGGPTAAGYLGVYDNTAAALRAYWDTSGKLTQNGPLAALTVTAGGLGLQGTNSGAGSDYSVLDFYPNKFLCYQISTDRFIFFNAGLEVGGDVSVVGTMRPATFTVATLPASGLVAGMRATVSDATAPTYLGALTGGGTVTCGVLYNGTGWVST